VIHSGPGKPYENERQPEESRAPEASPGGKTARYEAGLFAVCAGAINSAVILLASANDKHPKGLANSSDQVGRNFMYHQADALLAISTEHNQDSYTKTWGTNQFYLQDDDPAYPTRLGKCSQWGVFITK
jgi:choline dehydrogenase-like flavoprotein